MLSPRRRPLRLVGPFAALAVLSACTVAGPQLTSTRFELGVAGDGPPATMMAAVPVPAEPTVTRTDLRLGDGSLAIEIAPAAGERRLMATVADVEKLVIRLESRSGSYLATPVPFTPIEVTIDRAAIAAGVRTHKFTGVPFGDFKVTVKAYDAAGVVIGVSSDLIAVSSPTPVVVAPNVRLNPTFHAATPIPTPAATPTPTPTPSEGAVETRVTLEEGVDLTQLPLVREQATYSFAGMEAMPGGGLAVMDAGLQVYDRDLNLLRSSPFAQVGNGTPMPDGLGGVYVWQTIGLRRLDPQGNLTTVIASPASPTIACAAPTVDGDVWVVRGTTMARLGPDGTTKVGFTLTTPPYQLVATSRKTVWCFFTNKMLQERAASGAVLRNINMSAYPGVFRELRENHVTGTASLFMGMQDVWNLFSWNVGSTSMVIETNRFEEPGALHHHFGRDGMRWLEARTPAIGASYGDDTPYFQRYPTGQLGEQERFHGQLGAVYSVVDVTGRLYQLNMKTKKLATYDLP